MDVLFPFFVQALQTFNEAVQKIKVSENLHRKTCEQVYDRELCNNRQRFSDFNKRNLLHFF